MKKLLILSVAIIALAVSASSVLAAATDIQFYGYTWFRETGTVSQYSDTRNDTSKASIERTYLRWKLKYEDNLEGNLTLDLPMKTGNTTNSDWTTLVKYAYVDVKNMLPEEGFLRVGVQPVYFAMLDKWEYPMIYKPLEDQLGLLSSADLGVSLQGFLPGGWGDYQIAALGGNGYSKPTETDNNTATDISLNIVPLPGLSVRGSLYNSVVSSGDAYAKEGVQAGKWFNGVAVNYYMGPLWFMWEGIEGMNPNSSKSDSVKVSGNSKMVMWTIDEKWDLGLREDIYNPDVNNDIGANNKTDLAQDRVIYGANYHWMEDLLVQLNYSKLTYDGGNQAYSANGAYTEYQTTLQTKWSF
jgi:hypothetical protein